MQAEYILTPSDTKAVEEGYKFFPDKADRAVKFIETYAVPPTIGQVIRLLPWQRDFVRRLYGWWDGATGTKRRYKRAIVSTAKKNGKTVLQGGILLYELFGGICPAPFVVSASTTRKNAGQIYNILKASINTSPRLKKLSKCLDSMKEIRYEAKGGKYNSFSADAGGAEGENISALVVDELHAHVSDKLYRSLEFAPSARDTGFTCVISTAGSDQSHVWYDLFRYAQGVQDGSIIDTAVLPLICTSDPAADIDDPQTWYQSNPSLGTSFTESDFRRDLETAKQQGTAALLSFRRYRLSQWVAGDDAFIDPAFWDALDKRPYTDAELKDLPLFVGCDLASTTDTSAVVQIWCLGDRRYYVRCHAWCCEAGVRKREQSNLPKYQTYAADRVLTITQGTAMDFRAIRRHLMDLKAKYNLRQVVFDQSNATETTNELMADGVPVLRMNQGHKDFTSPIKEFEIAIKEKRIVHDGNRMLRWALSNARLDVNANGDAKFDKDKSTDKIDPAVAAVMAFKMAVTHESTSRPRASVYDTRGVILIG